MRALVTGGSGFIGLYIVEQLVARGAEVRVLSRSAPAEFQTLGVEHIAGDLRDRQLIDRAVAGVDVVFHVAGLTGIWRPWREFYNVNVVGTRSIIDACQRHGVSRLVYTSSPSVIFDGCPHENGDETLPYPDRHLGHYSHTKMLAEQAVLAANGQHGLTTAAIRPHLVWGPRDESLAPKIIEKGAAGKLRRIGDGTNRISISYVENVAAAHLQLADALTPDHPTSGQAYFINDPEPVNLWNWIDDLLQLVGQSPINKSISADRVRRAGRICEILYTLLPLPGEPPMTRFVAAQLSQSHFYSIDKARRDFNYTPIVSLEEGRKKWEREFRNRFAP